MRDAQVTPGGDRIRWIDIPGDAGRPARVYLHGLGASAGPYFTAAAVHPLLAGPRSLLLDLLGFGISDRPTDFGYTLEDHADAVATALRAADVGPVDLVGHSMGGAVAIVLAARHPELVARLVLVDANLDPVPLDPPRPGSSGIAAHTEEEFLAGGWRTVRDRVGPHWWSTMRLAGRAALHRTAVHLARGTTPTMRELLLDLPVPRHYLRPAADGPLPGEPELLAAGVAVVPVPDCGHNIMLDNPQAFAEATARALRVS
ncbi:alpha/beta fold hydrolase [Kitasatospora viridis]|uniref:Pimeloyl-ACP methyl ester carboxylesterase n=1 Tax=Kitasatospora viridis TaxID=281105 RepID=A0A561UHA6_9ACTN|nr:alpha/beta fold hydrolase [Kitasatospora viridis]TWF98750.1 pimeloyl-ACP methyl ester carboxylesterase [Kitasatospora viridis]